LQTSGRAGSQTAADDSTNRPDYFLGRLAARDAETLPLHKRRSRELSALKFAELFRAVAIVITCIAPTIIAVVAPLYATIRDSNLRAVAV
jgi:hypothetical protein